MKYNDGVMLMADTGASYGSLARFTSIPRLHKINDKVLVGFSGELSDWQFIEGLLREITIEDFMEGDNIEKTPEMVHTFLTRVMHNYRNRGDPLWCELVTAGIGEDGKPFLGYCNLWGTTFVDSVVATGFGLHMALPLLRKGQSDDMKAEEARKLLEDSHRVLVYRHCRTINKFTVATVDGPNGIKISDPFPLTTKWNYKRFVNPRHQESQENSSESTVNTNTRNARPGNESSNNNSSSSSSSSSSS